MSYVLGSTTLPNPKRLDRNIIEEKRMNKTIHGLMRQRIVNRKEQYRLEYRDLTQAQVSNIFAEYNLMTTRSFTVSDGRLSIGPVEVHVDIDSRVYNTKGPEYREDINLILTEVK